MIDNIEPTNGYRLLHGEKLIVVRDYRTLFKDADTKKKAYQSAIEKIIDASIDEGLGPKLAEDLRVSRAYLEGLEKGRMGK